MGIIGLRYSVPVVKPCKRCVNVANVMPGCGACFVLPSTLARLYSDFACAHPRSPHNKC